MPFYGFSRETSNFLWDLAFHNERPWFTQHKEEFLRVVKEPFDAMAVEVQTRMQERYPKGEWNLHVSRIYRDARRLYGRGPYKDHLWFTVWDGAPGEGNPAFWFEISAHSYGYGMGFWETTPAEMEAFRASVLADGAELSRLARRLNRQQLFTLSGEDYKRPKGDVGKLLNPWYNKKSISLDAEFDFGGDVLSLKLPAIVTEDFDFLMPYYRYFRRFRQSRGEE